MRTDRRDPTRRDVLKGSALLGGSAILAGNACAPARLPSPPPVDYELNSPDQFVYTACLQCHTACPIRVKVQDGTAVKIDGNPYSAQTLLRPVRYRTELRRAAPIDGKICPKGQAGLQTLYDPYRIVTVLKRTGRRGENRWKTIPFDQAIREIVEGGTLFADVPGEETRRVPGLKDLFALRDPQLAAAMSTDAMAVGRGEMSREAFRQKYAQHLGVLIDPDRPDLGPVNNQFVFLAGRIEHGRKEFSQRWLNGGFGSVNWYEHTTVCEQSHHIAYARMTDQYAGGRWTDGKDHMKPDLYRAEFVVFWGTGAFEANFGPPVLSELVTARLVDGSLKIAVVDPRFSATAAKAWKWLPVSPGKDGALAWAMIRWLLDHDAYDGRFLSNANRAAAAACGELTWTNATWLVRMESDGPGAFLRAADIGIGDPHSFVVVKDGKPKAVAPYSESDAVQGDLFFAGEIGGLRVVTAFQLLKDYATQRTFDEWVEEAGLRREDVEPVVRELARHGKRAGIELYRGPVQHTNGYYTAQAIITLNLLLGNVDWKGGLSKGGGHWHEDGSKPGQPFPLTSGLHPGRLTAFGHRLTREKASYEHSTYFQDEGYPARRPWYPLTANVYQEVIPSAADRYPYPIRALFLHKGTPALSIPGAQTVIDVLTDLEAIPLFFACDIVIGDTSVYADYIFPDTAIWERWGTPHQTPAVPVAGSKVRQPTVEPVTEKVRVFGEEMPLSMEAVMLAIAEKLGLPGYGKDGFAPGQDFTRPEDFYLKLVANVAAGDGPGDAVPDADSTETDLFLAARRHLSRAVFDPERFQRSVTDLSGKNWWPKVVYVLNRGGRFEDLERYDQAGDKLPHPFKGLFSLYVESVATTRHSHSGERFSGLGIYEPVRAYDGSVVDDREHPLQLITYKSILGGQSRTLPTNYWMAVIRPENTVQLNPATAAELGIRNGDVVRVVSATNPAGIWDLRTGRQIPMEGRVQLSHRIRPGVVCVSWSYGHWAYGSTDTIIDGRRYPGDPRRATGLCTNAALRLDPVLKNVCLSDPIGGSTSFYDTRVSLLKVRRGEEARSS